MIALKEDIEQYYGVQCHLTVPLPRVGHIGFFKQLGNFVRSTEKSVNCNFLKRNKLVKSLYKSDLVHPNGKGSRYLYSKIISTIL